MRSNKGFTIVELVLSFSITSVLLVLLFMLLLSLKNLYDHNAYRTELLIKQANMSEQLNKELSSKTIISIDNCGLNCLTFNFLNNESSTLSINEDNKTFNYGNYSTKLVLNSEFGDPTVEYYKNVSNVYNNLDSYILIDIPIYYPLYEDENFGVKVVYQYNSNNVLLDEVPF